MTSNPSHEYVERVAGAFNDNGSGVRGSLWAMVKAILLDPEARREPTDPIYGHLKEPVLYMNNVLRAFHAMSADRATQTDGNLEPYAREQGQKVWKPPTVFSYYPQFYFAPPASAGLLGPEFGIMNSQTSLKRANFVNQMTIWGGISADDGDTPYGTSLDFAELQHARVQPGQPRRPAQPAHAPRHHVGRTALLDRDGRQRRGRRRSARPRAAGPLSRRRRVAIPGTEVTP